MRESIREARAARIRECDGMSSIQAARTLGVCRQTVVSYRRAAGYRVTPSKMAAHSSAIMECAARGMTRAETAAHLNLSFQTMCRYAREAGIDFRRAGTGVADRGRAEVMAAMYRGGRTLEEIGTVYGITRERVRQIIKKDQGITGVDGGNALRARLRRQEAAGRRDARCLQQFGCTYAQWNAIIEVNRAMQAEGRGGYKRPTYAFASQRNNAKRRGIEWSLTLLQWWQIWEASGKFDKRGRERGGYVMCRFGDTGAYEVGNVYIATNSHNCSVQPNNPYRKNHPDHASVMEARAA